jgi:hypothetical protein
MAKLRPIALALLAVPAVTFAAHAGMVPFKAEGPLNKLRTVKLDLEFGAGTLGFGPGVAAGKLYSVAAVHDENFDPRAQLAGGTLSLSSKRRGAFSRSGKNDWTVHLSDVPTWDMNLSVGAAKATIDFSGMRVRELSFDTGASQVELGWSKPNPIPLEEARIRGGAATVALVGLGYSNVKQLQVQGGAGRFDLDFSGPLNGVANVDIQAGIGQITMEIPKAVGLRVLQKDVALAQVKWPADLKPGSQPETANYAKAKAKIDLSLSAAVGRIVVTRK